MIYFKVPLGYLGRSAKLLRESCFILISWPHTGKISSEAPDMYMKGTSTPRARSGFRGGEFKGSPPSTAPWISPLEDCRLIPHGKSEAALWLCQFLFVGPEVLLVPWRYHFSGTHYGCNFPWHHLLSLCLGPTEWNIEFYWLSSSPIRLPCLHPQTGSSVGCQKWETVVKWVTQFHTGQGISASKRLPSLADPGQWD